MMDEDIQMGLSDKMFFEFYCHVIECLRLWTNDDPDMMEYYIKNYVPEMYKEILKGLIEYDTNGRMFYTDPDSVDIVCHRSEDDYVYFTYEFDSTDEETILFFYKKFCTIIDRMFSDELKIDVTKYSYVPNGIQFIIEIYYRIYLSYILVNSLFNLRNKINSINIKNTDSSELLASSLFCRTIFLDLVNGNCVPYEESRYELVDTFGINKQISCDIFIDNEDGDIALTNIIFEY